MLKIDLYISLFFLDKFYKGDLQMFSKCKYIEEKGRIWFFVQSTSERVIDTCCSQEWTIDRAMIGARFAWPHSGNSIPL